MKATLAIALLALVAAPAAAQEKANPFTGTTAAFEQRLRTLEEKKLDAAIANEDLATEKANQERLRLRIGKAAGFQDSPIAEPSKAPVRRAPPAARVSEPFAADVQARPKAPRLVGTVSTPAGRVALIERGAQVLNVPEGETVDGVRASAITQDSALINGVAMKLEEVTARVIAPAPNALNSASRIAGSPIAGIAPAPMASAPTDAIDLGAAPFRK